MHFSIVKDTRVARRSLGQIGFDPVTIGLIASAAAPIVGGALNQAGQVIGPAAQTFLDNASGRTAATALNNYVASQAAAEQAAARQKTIEHFALIALGLVLVGGVVYAVMP